MLNEVLSPKPELFISHNVHVEKNLIKKYLPYSVKNSNDGKVQWGPWIDTRILYKRLYPKLDKFNLEYLTQIFVFNKVSEEAKSIPLKKELTTMLYLTLFVLIFYISGCQIKLIFMISFSRSNFF